MRRWLPRGNSSNCLPLFTWTVPCKVTVAFVIVLLSVVRWGALSRGTFLTNFREVSLLVLSLGRRVYCGKRVSCDSRTPISFPCTIYGRFKVQC